MREYSCILFLIVNKPTIPLARLLLVPFDNYCIDLTETIPIPEDVGVIGLSELSL